MMPQTAPPILTGRICEGIEIEPQGLDRWVVYNPFTFDDGDHFVVVLKRERGRWLLTDEGHTFMHLSYSGVDLSKGQRGKLVEQALEVHGVENAGGELRVAVDEANASDGFFSFIQATERIANAALWTRDRVASTFKEDFRELMERVIDPARLTFDYHDPKLDPEALYPVDCRINGMARPCFAFAVGNNDQCKQATISHYFYEQERVPFRSVVMFEDQTGISRKAVAQLSNVAGKQFPSLGDENRIRRFFEEEVLAT